MASTLLLSSAGGNHFESSAMCVWLGSCVQQHNRDKPTDHMQVSIFFLEKSQHILQIMFHMYCRSENYCAFIYSLIFHVVLANVQVIHHPTGGHALLSLPVPN